MKIFILLLVLISGCYAIWHSSDGFSIKGKIYTTGNEPFVELAIQTEDGRVFIISRNSPVYKELWKNQGSTVVLEVTGRDTKGIEKGKILVKSFKILSK
ncbi:MAG: hypothetical protein RMJ81_09500 [Candidatus Kryptonium sp.]|nr:hypothetical protein [Candidatus Kryptonium sp.]MDW8109868.1 hypothetical protein [Candidatus Kryptonium sp.]